MPILTGLTTAKFPADVIDFVIISVVYSTYSAEVDKKRGLLRAEAAFKNPTIYSKIALTVYK